MTQTEINNVIIIIIYALKVGEQQSSARRSYTPLENFFYSRYLRHLTQRWHCEIHTGQREVRNGHNRDLRN